MKCLLNTPPGFDIDEVAGLAKERGFDGIQLYLNRTLADMSDRLEQWCLGLEQRSLELAVHLPSVLDAPVLEALNRISRPGMAVISHYPEQQFLPSRGRAAWEFSPFGILPDEYGSWLDHCRDAGAIPVFDLPRVFRETDEQEAGRAADHLFTDLAGVRYILHLIDCGTAGQERADWCVLGQGRVGRYLERSVFPLPDMAVLEYDSLIQSGYSLPWLRRLTKNSGL